MTARKERHPLVFVAGSGLLLRSGVSDDGKRALVIEVAHFGKRRVEAELAGISDRLEGEQIA